ncbi:MAG: response regulator [Pseudobutyrivibrio sp.]|nr:response regulator [Pseudobutyrivibrio sp.]
MTVEELIIHYNEIVGSAFREFGKYNELLNRQASFEEWKGMLVGKTEHNRQLYIKYNDAVENLKNRISQGLTDDGMEALYDYVISICDEREYQDPPVYLFILKVLIDYYEREHNYGKLARLYSYYLRAFDQHYAQSDAAKVEEAMEMGKAAIRMGIKHVDVLKKEAERTKNEEILLNIIIIGIHLITNHSKDCPSIMAELEWGYENIQKYYSYIKNEKILEESDSLKIQMDRLNRQILTVFYQILTLHPDEMGRFFDFLDKKKIISNDEYVNLLFLIEKEFYLKPRGDEFVLFDLQKLLYKYVLDITAGELPDIERLRDDYDKLNDLIHIVMTMTFASDLEPDAKRNIIQTAAKSIIDCYLKCPPDHLELIGDVDKVVKAIFAYNIPLAKTMEEKEGIVLDYALKRHPSVYVHSLMVQEIAVLITEALFENRPDLLIPLKELRLSPSEQMPPGRKDKNFRKDLINYISKAALFHDLGKCVIGQVVNMQMRPLSSDEVRIVRKHPQKGMELIQNDKDFDIYRDIILGHHKFYDGQGGYPATFDNLSSPYKICIDIISIADTIDAATDYLGRNYAVGKNFDQVLEELIEESGTRYNGVIVSSIAKNVDLRKQLQILTGQGRFETYYGAYHIIQKEAKERRGKDKIAITVREKVYFSVVAIMVIGALFVGFFYKYTTEELSRSAMEINENSISDSTAIVDTQGNIIVYTKSSIASIKYKNILDEYADVEFIEGTDEGLRDFLENCYGREKYVLKYRDGAGTGIITVSKIVGHDWFLVQIFPAEMTGQVIESLSWYSTFSSFVVFAVFFIAFAIAGVAFIRNRNKLRRQVREASEEEQRLITALKEANNRAIDAASEANAANRAKSDFLAKMSHELRTPMNAVIGMTDVMLREERNREDQRYLMNIKSSGTALLQIINDILDLSKIESGKMDIINQEYDILSVLEDLSMMFYSRIDKKPIELLYDVDRDIPKTLIGDQARVRQILINIVNNAIKFTEKGYIKLSVFTKEAEEEDEIILCFSIKDTGIGIKPEDKDKLFGSFTRVDQKKNAGVEGTGLGLSITKNLVELMNGKISVESVYGQGSEFIVEIIQMVNDKEAGASIDDAKTVDSPLVLCLSADEYMGPLMEKLATGYGFSFQDKDTGLCPAYIFADLESYRSKVDMIKAYQDKGAKVFVPRNPFDDDGDKLGDITLFKPVFTKNFCDCINGHERDEEEDNSIIEFTAPNANILLAEDIDMNVQVARALFAPLGFAMDVASNGKEAVEMVEKKDYDLVLMDHMMPIMDGIEATESIRKLGGEKYKNLPIIALSANVIDSIVARFYEAGMNDVAHKPIDMEEITKILVKWLPEDEIVLGPKDVRSDFLVTTQSAKKPDRDMVTKTIDRLENFPEGLDYELAMKNSYTKDILLQNLRNYYLMIDTKASRMEDCLKDDLIKDYTIEVHAMKNSSRYIGAAMLGNWFEKMEKAGNDLDIGLIKEETPALMAKFRSMKEVLSDFKPDESALLSIDNEELVDMLSVMIEAVDSFDMDMVDSVMKELKKYAMPEGCRQIMEKLIVDVADVKMDLIKTDAKAILDVIG